MMMPGRSLMPLTFRTKLVYCDPWNNSVPASATISWNSFRLNGLYDPWYTGTGHQPMGYDQMCLFYDNYLVTGCKVIWQGKVQTADDVQLFMNAQPVTAISLPSTLTVAKEDRLTRGKATTNTGSFEFTKYYTIAEVYGMSRADIENDTSFCARTNTHPTLSAIVSLAAIAVDAAAFSINSTITLIYYCEFSRPITIGPSFMAALEAARAAEPDSDSDTEPELVTS